LMCPNSSFLNIRVKDIDAVYAEWSARGAEFLTPPKQHQYEKRCYIRDPDGHLIEVGQPTDPRGGLVARSLAIEYARRKVRVKAETTREIPHAGGGQIADREQCGRRPRAGTCRARGARTRA
jgi:Glyoxalase/Bleomycin resistance protein/Dioxygenase superfamily